MKKGFLFISIGFKLILIVSILLGVSLSGLTLLSSWFFSADIERTLRTNTMERVELLSDKIETDLATTINSARLIAATMEGGLVYAGTGTAATEELLAQNKRILNVRIVTMENNVPTVTSSAREVKAPIAVVEPSETESVAESGAEPAVANETKSQGEVEPSDVPESGTESMAAESPNGLSAYIASRLTPAFAGNTIVANVSPETGSASIAILFPYQMRSDSEAASVVVLEISADPYIDALSARELYTNYLVDDAGNLIAHNNRELVLARTSLASDAIVRDSMAGETALKQMQFTGTDGHAYIGSWKRFFDGGLSVISVVRRDTALEGVYILQRRNILITIMILCVSMLLLYSFSKSLTNPVKRLMDGALKIGKGDFSIEIPSTTHDEIGRLSTTFNAMTKGLAERDKIKNAFGKFVNKEVAERVLKGEIQLGGESRTAAIFFSDIRSFTAISEKLTPHEVVEFLNEYMTRMVDCVNATHGVVDKYIGDSIMATWGIPYSHGNDTENAVNGALMMRKALAEFNKSRGSDKKPIIKIGSGINTGEVVAGQIGSPERMEYTCIGDAVNLASRIESLNKLFKTDILISEYSQSLVKSIFRTVPMKQILVKGKEHPQQIYAVLGRFDDPSSFKTLSELRASLGLEDIALENIDPNAQEQKYEVIN